MLVLEGVADTLIDELLPEEVKLLSGKLQAVDALLDDPGVLAAFRGSWERPGLGRPSMPMATYARLMYLKDTTGWGYEALMAQVSDSLQLRRFCRIPVIDAVPDESTVRKLTRRLGAEVIDQVTRAVIEEAVAHRAFARGRSVLIPRSPRPTSPTPRTSVCAPTRYGCSPRQPAASAPRSPMRPGTSSTVPGQSRNGCAPSAAACASARGRPRPPCKP
jgi:hypothetical protein